MSNTRQRNRSASGFSPASTSFQQTRGESVRLSSMAYASPQGHMPYPDNHLGQPSVGLSHVINQACLHGYMPDPANNLGLPSTGYSRQRGYMPCPENRQPVSFCRFQPRQAPIPARDTTRPRSNRAGMCEHIIMWNSPLLLHHSFPV